MSFQGQRLGRRVLLALVQVVVSAVVCGGMLVAAVLVPPPTPVLAVLVVVSVGVPMTAGFALRAAVSPPGDVAAWRAMAQLRRQLARLPDGEHPLGL